MNKKSNGSLFALVEFLGAMLIMAGLSTVSWSSDSPLPPASPKRGKGSDYPATREGKSDQHIPKPLSKGEGAIAENDAPPWLIVSIRTKDNEYYHAIIKGAKLFAESINAEDKLIFLFCEGSSEKQVTDLIKTLKKTGRHAIVYFDPNEAAVMPRLARICTDKGVYFASEWNCPEDVNPWDFDPYWVVHSTPDSREVGYQTARTFCLAMNGRGKLLALQGRLGNSSGKGRYKGLMKAVEDFPDIELFNAFVNDWGRVKSMKATERWMQRMPEIHGVWGACDEMALGALEVIRASGKAGKIKVTGVDATGDAVNAIIAGEMLCTVSPDPYWQVGMSLSFAYHAYCGKLDVTKIPHEKRAFYLKTTLITQKNAKEYLENYVNGKPSYNYKDLWKDKWLGPIRSSKSEVVPQGKSK
jgi:ribose transport system substrate-binding protein